MVHRAIRLAEARPLSDDVGRQEHARDESSVAADEEVGDTPLDVAQARQGTATRAGALFPCADVADPVADQWHCVVEQIGHENAAHLARLRWLVFLHDLDEQSFRHDVQSLVSVALTGNHADFAATVAVEHGTAEDALHQGPFGRFEYLCRRDNRVRPMRVQAPLLQVLSEQQHRASVSLEDARPMVL
jgi:hypothetical protein